MECSNSYTKFSALAYAIVLAVTATIVLAAARVFLAKPIDIVELSISAALVFILGFAVLWYFQSRCCRDSAKPKVK